ncbi:hypothetical protein F4604DRAFT_2024687 [Suillus subluteus]|nr:hypothetical protein F4604DRAFT_2024687 [Suillus subluteus]
MERSSFVDGSTHSRPGLTVAHEDKRASAILNCVGSSLPLLSTWVAVDIQEAYYSAFRAEQACQEGLMVQSLAINGDHTCQRNIELEFLILQAKMSCAQAEIELYTVAIANAREFDFSGNISTASSSNGFIPPPRQDELCYYSEDHDTDNEDSFDFEVDLYESCNSQISDVIDAYARASKLDPGNHVISQRLQLLKKAQATGDPLPAAPGPQDVHPTTYSPLRLDGTVDIDITHQNGSTAIYPLSRLTKLYDSLEQFEDDGWEGEEDGSDQGSHVDNANGVWHQDSDGWRYDPDNSEWEDEEDCDEDGGGMDVDTWADDIDIPLSDSIPDSLIQRYVSPDVADSASPFPVSSSNTSSDSTQEIIVQGDEDGHADTPWKKFEVLPGALRDHAFYSSVSNQPSKNYLARLTKEYRALSTSLPADSILVHAPPIAHFLSWTNGNGHVNPNLYEEGKVCLSILGTWSGDRTETWSTARSSLLQASVSIQGLVLVKEPWFCEPAYEKLRGTEEGMVNSEKAYVLSRGFVRCALEIPVGGLEAEIDWLYNTQGRLTRVLDDSRALIQKSQSGPENADTDQNLDLHIPSPAPAPASRSSPGPF